MSLAVLPGLLVAAVSGALTPGAPLVKVAVAGLVALPAAGASLAFADVRRRLEPAEVTRIAAHATSASIVALPVLAVLGAMLKANTHHRALGGTTFSVLAVIVIAGALLFGGRLARLVTRGDLPTQVAALAVFVIVWATALTRAELLSLARLDHAAIVAAIAIGFSLGARLARPSAPALALTAVVIVAGFGVAAATPAGQDVVARGGVAGAFARVVRPSKADPG